MKVRISRTSDSFNRYTRIREFKDFNELFKYAFSIKQSKRYHNSNEDKFVIETASSYNNDNKKFDYELEIYDDYRE